MRTKRLPSIALLLTLSTGGLAQAERAHVRVSSWRAAFDLDGDGIPDRIEDTFTGGAHCCYRIDVVASASGRRVRVPFELDGGFVMGLDLSQPSRFAVGDFDGDGVAEIRMEIATYNGERMPLPAAWRRRFGVRSHRVSVRVRSGRLVVENLPEP